MKRQDFVLVILASFLLAIPVTAQEVKLLFPQWGDTVYFKDVALKWEPLEQANRYGVVFDALIPGEPMEFRVRQYTTTPEFRFNKVGENQIFYWCVIAYQNDEIIGRSGFWRFYTTSQAPTPKGYTLFQNYPNPFNPETTIEYQLPVAGHVRFSIFTVLGQEVRRLVDRSQDAAYHVVVWDGRDDTGNVVPSGMYFYRLESGSFTAMKKMIMVK